MHTQEDSRHVASHDAPRRGAFLVLAFFCLAGCLTFVAFTVDIGYLSLTKTRMQNAVDAAALAAAQEITAAIANAPADIENVTLYAEQQARQVAAQVAELNGVYVDPTTDVRFGQRKSSGAGGDFGIVWDSAPYNVVKVTARRDGNEPGDPDAKLKLFFAGVTGDRYAMVQTDAIAYVEARDLVIVHDFSRSMNFDSFFQYESGSQLSHSQTLANLETAYHDLNPPVPGMVFEPAYYAPTESADNATATVTFRYDKADVNANCDIQQVRLRFGSREQTFNGQGTSGTFQGTGNNHGRDITEVHVTLTPEDSAQAVTLTGVPPNRNCLPQIEVTYSADRKSISVSATKDLSNVVLQFENGVHFKFDGLSGKTGNFSGSGAFSGMTIQTVWVKSGCNQSNDGPGYGERFNAPTGSGTSSEVTLSYYDTNPNVMQFFGWDQVPYPYPSGSWNAMINHSRTHAAHRDAGYREMYGGLTLMNYILQSEVGHARTPDLWKVRHYPFHAIKEGHELLCNLLDGLGFDDHIGMVSYDSSHRIEMILDEQDPQIPYVNISSQPITNNYAAVNSLMKYRQAGHYSYATNMGGGLKSATQLLDNYRRPGARPTILLMTDGNTNTMDPGESSALPPGWDWNKLFDYDKDGAADYITNVAQKRYVLRLAKEAVDKGFTIHTMSVGIDADTELMQAIAHLGKGHWINVPGGLSVADMEQEVDAAFQRIASFVPPAKLLHDTEHE